MINVDLVGLYVLSMFFLLVGFALNMLFTPFLGNYGISMNPRAICIFALAVLVTLQCRGPWVH